MGGGPMRGRGGYRAGGRGGGGREGGKEARAKGGREGGGYKGGGADGEQSLEDTLRRCRGHRGGGPWVVLPGKNAEAGQ